MKRTGQPRVGSKKMQHPGKSKMVACCNTGKGKKKKSRY